MGFGQRAQACKLKTEANLGETGYQLSYRCVFLQRLRIGL